MKWLFIALRVVLAVILLQTLWFKFGAAPESKYIFTQLGIEPYGRIGIGVLELIGSIMLFVPTTKNFASLFCLGLMAGAICSHVLVLGIVVQDDSGKLFALACICFALAGILLARAQHESNYFTNFIHKINIFASK